MSIIPLRGVVDLRADAVFRPRRRFAFQLSGGVDGRQVQHPLFQVRTKDQRPAPAFDGAEMAFPDC